MSTTTQVGELYRRSLDEYAQSGMSQNTNCCISRTATQFHECGFMFAQLKMDGKAKQMFSLASQINTVGHPDQKDRMMGSLIEAAGNVYRRGQERGWKQQMSQYYPPFKQEPTKMSSFMQAFSFCQTAPNTDKPDSPSKLPETQSITWNKVLPTQDEIYKLMDEIQIQRSFGCASWVGQIANTCLIESVQTQLDRIRKRYKVQPHYNAVLKDIMQTVLNPTKRRAPSSGCMGSYVDGVMNDINPVNPTSSSSSVTPNPDSVPLCPIKHVNPFMERQPKPIPKSNPNPNPNYSSCDGQTPQTSSSSSSESSSPRYVPGPRAYQEDSEEDSDESSEDDSEEDSDESSEDDSEEASDESSEDDSEDDSDESSEKKKNQNRSVYPEVLKPMG
jgi:hypothetical protein